MTGNFLPFLADRLLNRPLLIHPDKAATIMHVIEGRITLGPAGDEPKPEANRFVGSIDPRSNRHFTRAAGKTAIITIDGSLVNRGAWINASSGLTSYEGIAAQLDEIAAEAKAGRLENLVIDMNSYGGEATGMAAIATKIRNLRKSMHIVSVVNDVAASAGYGIVSGSDEIVISPTSLVGSIGVVMMHMDRSREMDAKGINVTFIHAGAKKVDGNPFGPLPENVRADMQKDVMAFYEQFLSTVEAGRGKARLSAKKARETEADVFIGQDAITAGLADRMASLDEVLAELSRPSRSASNSKNQTNRSTQMGYREDETAQAVADERNRIQSILTLPEAAARPASAQSLAFAAGVSVDAAKKALAALPEETAKSGIGALGSVPSIEQRASGLREIGSNAPHQAEPAAAKSGWAKAIAAANAKALTVME